jgi:hypothetical protein
MKRNIPWDATFPALQQIKDADIESAPDGFPGIISTNIKQVERSNSVQQYH